MRFFRPISMLHIVMLLTLLHFMSLMAGDLSVEDMNHFKHSIGFRSYYSRITEPKKIKIGILDKGFLKYDEEIGKSLPSTTIFHDGAVDHPQMTSNHGTVMAQVLIDLLTDSLAHTEFVSEIHLFYAGGFSNFEAAVKKAIEIGVDVILYSEVWEYGGNHDGKGFLNAVVDEAIQSGIIWVNAAGNFNKSTYNTTVNTIHDDWIALPCTAQSLHIRCNAGEGGSCPLRAVLSWNDFKDNTTDGTFYDLDLLVTDDMHNLVATSQLVQSFDPNEERLGFSKYPRELVTVEVPTGLYFVKVKNRSHNFESHHKMRLSASGENIELPEMCLGGRGRNRSVDESLLNPADHPGVITVGALDFSSSSVSRRLRKPEIVTASTLRLGGQEIKGSSVSAAVVAAGIALLKVEHPELTSKDVVDFLRGGTYRKLGFQFTGPGCFRSLPLSPNWHHLWNLSRIGGVLVETTEGAKMMMELDPITLAPYLMRRADDDMVLALPYGFELAPRSARRRIPPQAVEVFRGPIDLICNFHRGDDVYLPSFEQPFHLP